MGWVNDYTGASAQKHINKYTDRPEDAGSMGGIQDLLSVIGMVPGAGEPADLINSLLYSIQGKKGEAGLSLLSMLPFLGSIKSARNLSKIPSKPGSTIGAGRRGDTIFPSEDTYETAVPRVEDYYQGIPAKSGGEGYFQSLLDGLFDKVNKMDF